MPDIFTLLFKSTVIVPTLAATAAAVTVILLSPKNSKSSDVKFKVCTVALLSLYESVLAPAAASTYAVVAIFVELFAKERPDAFLWRQRISLISPVVRILLGVYLSVW